MFTSKERKFLIESVKYDVYSTSYSVLKESGLPVSNLDVRVNTKKLIENYLQIPKTETLTTKKVSENYFKLSKRKKLILKEGAWNTIKSLAKGFFDLLKAAFAIVSVVGIGGFIVNKVRQIMRNKNEYSGYDANEFVDAAADAARRSTEYNANEFVDAYNDAARRAAGYDANEFVDASADAAKRAAVGAEQATQSDALWSKVSGKVSSVVSSINNIIVSALQKIGIGEELARSIAPVAMIVGSFAAALVLYKTLKLIIAGVKKLVAKWKSGGKEKLSRNDAAALATASIKMQKSAAGKIKNKTRKAKVEKIIAKKEARVKKLVSSKAA